MGILHLSNKTRVCELIEKVTSVNVNQDCWGSCHPLTSDKKNKIIFKFSRRKDAESVLRNKNKKKRILTLEVWTLIVTKSLSMKLFVTNTGFFRVSVKSCTLKSASKLLGKQWSN